MCVRRCSACTTHHTIKTNRWFHFPQISANRSKLMRAMAHQKLQVNMLSIVHAWLHRHYWHVCPLHQTEVAALAATSAKKKAAIFTPYLMPDAISLCEGLHTVKRLLKTEKFVCVVARSGELILCITLGTWWFPCSV